MNIEFTDNLEPTFGDHNGNPISLKKIHEIESINHKPITMIAVTRKQFDESDLDRYKRYIINDLGFPRFYHGFWHDGDNIEFDILYAIPTDDRTVILEHLNKHNKINDGHAQIMGLVIHMNGDFEKVVNENTKYY